jgi:type I restriction enzyme, S subunit
MDEIKIERYPAYKDSGVDWLGKIPEHWELTNLGKLLEPTVTKNKPELPLLSITREKGVILRSLDNEEENHNFIPDDLSNYKVLEEGQFGMNKMKAWQGSYGISAYTGIVSPAYFIFKLAAGIDPTYFHIAIRSRLYVSFFGSASDGVRVGQWDLSKERMKQIPFLIPAIKEQKAIANFLHRKTAQINKAIAQKEKLIELLKERRQILIHNAVTRGLNPNVPLKDSGVEWIGKIPEHWNFEPIKHSLYGIIDTEHKTAPFVDEGEYFVVRTSNVKDGRLTFKDAKYTHASGFKEWTRRGIPKPGDIFLTREAPAGEACIIPDNTNLVLGQRMVWLKINKKRLLPQLAIYFIYSKIGRTYIDFLSAGSTVLHFNMADIKNIPIISIPIEEQEEIIRHIELQSSKIDRAVTFELNQIKKLKEYKATLINAAVTGKIKVA